MVITGICKAMPITLNFSFTYAEGSSLTSNWAILSFKTWMGASRSKTLFLDCGDKKILFSVVTKFKVKNRALLMYISCSLAVIKFFIVFD